MQGRKPKPTMLANLHGRPSKDKASPHEPMPAGDLADAPDWMSADQKDGWAYAIGNAPIGMLKLIDRGVMQVWVAAEALHREALMAQAKVGLLVKAPITGVPMQSPYLAIINRQGLIMLKAASELGFSPVSRPRIGIVAPFGAGAPVKDHGKAAPKRSLNDFLADAPGWAN